VAETPSDAGALFLRVADSGDAIAAVQIPPCRTELNWLGTLDPAAVVCGVTGTVLLIDGKTTKLVCVGPNPATGIGFVDLDTGVLPPSIGQSPMLVRSWTLVPGFTPS
jgi:hypothetical protein